MRGYSGRKVRGQAFSPGKEILKAPSGKIKTSREDFSPAGGRFISGRKKSRSHDK